MIYSVGAKKTQQNLVTPVQESDFPALQALLEQNGSKDYYQTSIGYYAITGRNGLWKAQRDNSVVLFCRHPNNPRVILVFPPVGKKGNEILYTVVQTLFKMGDEIQFARFENNVPSKYFPSQFLEKEEETLDWTYPVQTVDTSKVADLSGGGFQQVRQKINRLDLPAITAQSIEPRVHVDDVRAVLQKWSTSEKHGIYFSLLKWFDHLPLQGRLIYYNLVPVAFTIWEETSQRDKVANGFANIGLYDVPGISSYAIYDMCRTLNERGFEKVCLGGSETAGLDRFKRLFCPVESADLRSFYDKRFISDVGKVAVSA